jgi:hypothetical protein
VSAFVPVPDCAQVALVHTMFDRPWEITLHFKVEAPPITPAAMSNLAVQVGGWWATGPLRRLSFAAFYEWTDVVDISGGSLPPVRDVTWSRAAGVATSSYPVSVCAVVSFHTAHGTGISRNRNYISGIPLGSLTRSKMPMAFASGLVSDYSDLIDAASSVGWVWSAVHTYSGVTPLSVGVSARVDHVRIHSLNVGQRRKRLHNTFFP